MSEIKQISLSEPQIFILESGKEINLFEAGVGSGKTHLAGIISYRFVEHFPQVKGFIGANTYDQLNTSTLFRIREVWKEYFGLYEDVHYVVGKQPPAHFKQDNHNFDSYNNIISFVNGAIVFKGSLENAKSHDGKEFAWAILDETKDTREEDVKEIILARLREQGIIVNGKPFNPLYITTSPAKVEWLNKWFNLDEYEHEILKSIFSKTEFFKKEFSDKCIAISSTYHNDANLPPGYIEKILNNNTKENAERLIYANPFSRTGGEFYSSFNRQSHSGNVPYLPDVAVHLTFDQNVVPYVTMCCWQVIKDGNILELRQFNEFCLSNPKNSTEKVCEEFKRKYDGLVENIFYYGDPSGKKQDTRGKENDYDIVRRVLRKMLNNSSDRTTRAYPGVIKRRDFINNIFDGRYEVKIIIDRDNCPNSITDYVYLKQDRDGKKLKEIVKDKVTGQKYEKYGHTSDANDYFITKLLEPEFDQFDNR